MKGYMVVLSEILDTYTFKRGALKKELDREIGRRIDQLDDLTPEEKDQYLKERGGEQGLRRRLTPSVYSTHLNRKRQRDKLNYSDAKNTDEAREIRDKRVTIDEQIAQRDSVKKGLGPQRGVVGSYSTMENKARRYKQNRFPQASLKDRYITGPGMRRAQQKKVRTNEYLYARGPEYAKGLEKGYDNPQSVSSVRRPPLKTDKENTLQRWLGERQGAKIRGRVPKKITINQEFFDNIRSKIAKSKYMPVLDGIAQATAASAHPWALPYIQSLKPTGQYVKNLINSAPDLKAGHPIPKQLAPMGQSLYNKYGPKNYGDIHSGLLAQLPRDILEKVK